MEYKRTPMGTTRVGNYLVTPQHNKFSLIPLMGLKCWLEGEIICDTMEDAERIATVFTSQDELTIAIRQMMIRRAQDTKEKD